MASQMEVATVEASARLAAARSAAAAAPARPRLLSVGLACVDVVNSVFTFPGEDQCCRATGQRRARGGNASTTACVAAQCGVAADWLGATPRRGSPDAEFLLADLRRHGAGALPVERPRCESAPTSYVILSESNGSRTIVHARGDLGELDAADAQSAPLADYDWVHLEGRAGARGYLETCVAALEGARTTASLELEKLDGVLDDLERRVDVVFYSRERAERDGFADPAAFLAAKAAAIGGPRVLTCAWGAGGAAAVAVDAAGAVDAFRCGVLPGVRPVDSVGAGDTFNGAFIAARLRGEDLETALKAACAVAGRKVARVGFAGLAYPPPEDIAAVPSL